MQGGRLVADGVTMESTGEWASGAGGRDGGKRGARAAVPLLLALLTARPPAHLHICGRTHARTHARMRSQRLTSHLKSLPLRAQSARFSNPPGVTGQRARRRATSWPSAALMPSSPIGEGVCETWRQE